MMTRTCANPERQKQQRIRQWGKNGGCRPVGHETSTEGMCALAASSSVSAVYAFAFVRSNDRFLNSPSGPAKSALSALSLRSFAKYAG